MTKVTNEEYENILSRLDSLEHNYERKILEAAKKIADLERELSEYNCKKYVKKINKFEKMYKMYDELQRIYGGREEDE